jgi:hypothetical protein
MLLTNPIWLWAFTGLLIPIGIHLLSRKEGKVIRIGSLRHLQETNTQQFKGIRLNEIVLLILRCTLITLFVLLMSGLSFERNRQSEVKWVLIEKGLEKMREVQAQLDTFQYDGYELHWLADGFPLYSDSTSVSSNNQYWRLAEQLQSEKISDAIVISKNKVDGFKGKRPSLAPNIRWVSVPSEPGDFSLKTVSLLDSVLVRTGYTQADKTYFTTRIFSMDEWNQSNQMDSIDSVDSVKIVIVADKTHQYDERIMEASLEAIGLSSSTKIEIVNSSPEKIGSTGYGNWCVWLSDQPVSDSIDSNIIYLKPELNPEILVQEKANRWKITKRLNEEIVLNESLTVKLASLLLSSSKDWETAMQHDKRMLSDKNAWSMNDSGESGNDSLHVQSADSYLLIFFLVTLFVERILAYYRNQ